MFGGIFAAKHQDFRITLYHHTPDVSTCTSIIIPKPK